MDQLRPNYRHVWLILSNKHDTNIQSEKDDDHKKERNKIGMGGTGKHFKQADHWNYIAILT